MNKDQILALARQLLTLGAGFVTAKWGIDGSALAAVSAGIVAALSIGFDMKNNSTSETLKAAAQIKATQASGS